MRRSVDVCIAGGGPAGMILGMLLSRAGIETLVLEKHADFLRDFRGDTVHPSTMEIFHDLGLLERFLQRPHHRADNITAIISGTEVRIGDFTHLPTKAKFIAFMPQWEFLDFVREVAEERPTFHLEMETQVKRLLFRGDAVVGVEATGPAGDVTIDARLVIGADGRHSVVRAEAELPLKDLGAPIDVLWMRLPRKENDRAQPFAIMERGRMLVMLNRGDYWQCASIIRKGALEDLKKAGLAAFRERIATMAPFLGDRVEALTDWDQIKLLTVRVDRLTQWARPGLLCIGDAAHAMSPVGGVGINLAIHDAVAAANLLVPALKRGQVTLDDLNRVQKRREFPTKIVQAAQIQAHKRVLLRILGKNDELRVPLPVKLFNVLPFLRGIPARAIGLGVRSERPDPGLFS